MEKQIENVDSKKDLLDSSILSNETKSKDDVIENYVALININKFYGKDVWAVKNFNLEIAQYEFVAFVGPSGCGKSTTLRMIAGLEDISSGELYIDGLYSNDIVPQNRDIAMVFQSYSLYPNMSVYDNMAFSLKVKKYCKEEIDQRVRKAADILQISDLLDRKPKALSGGQRQRVALGRAVVRDAKVFLMDEPLSNLDAKLRVSTRSEIVKLHKRIKATTIYVTHDQIEAMTMADRIVVMNKGLIQQVGTPFEIYHHPSNKFVASFIGSPAMNFALGIYKDGRIIFNDGFTFGLYKEEISKHDSFYKNREMELKENIEKTKANLFSEEEYVNKLKGLKLIHYQRNKHNKKIQLEEELSRYQSELDKVIDINKGKEHEIIFGIRPEDINLTSSDFDFDRKIDISELLGDEYYLHFAFGGNDFLSKVSLEKIGDLKEKKHFKFEHKKTHIFDKESERTIF